MALSLSMWSKKTVDISLQQFDKEILEGYAYWSLMGEHLQVLCFPLGVVCDILCSHGESELLDGEPPHIMGDVGFGRQITFWYLNGTRKIVSYLGITSEGWYSLEDRVSVSMLWTDGWQSHICTRDIGLEVVASVWVDTSVLSCDRNLGYCI
jgi:hypothetical protein